MKNKSKRPPIDDKNVGTERYDEIILVFPIWWYVSPTVVNTFLESYELKWKRIVLFPTSGSSGFGNTANELKPSVDDSTSIEEGKVAHSKSNKNEVEGWVKNIIFKNLLK